MFTCLALLGASESVAAAVDRFPEHDLDAPLDPDLLRSLPGRLVELGPSSYGSELAPKREQPQQVSLGIEDGHASESMVPAQVYSRTTEADGGQTAQFSFGHGERRFEYTVDLIELNEAAETARVHAGIQYDNPLPSGEEFLEDEIEKAWSEEDDARVRRAYADGYDVKAYKMVAKWGTCSAHVVNAGDEWLWVLTAAHCLFITTNGVVNPEVLLPRTDSTGDFENDEVPFPYGKWRYTHHFVDSKFLENGCKNLSVPLRCAQWDFALVRFKRLPDTSNSVMRRPVGMRYGLAPIPTLKKRAKYRRGYPSCTGGAIQPSGCNPSGRYMYGDGRLKIGKGKFRNPAGWWRVLAHGSDTSNGDSGSGLYYYDKNNVTRVFAVHVGAGENCQSCESSTPNRARRITPVWYDLISTLTW